MIKQLFIHFCIAATFMFLSGALFRNEKILTLNKDKLLLGFLAGLLGSILLYFSIRITDFVFLDLRCVAIIISVVYGGMVPALITTSMIAASRVIFFPVSYSAIASVITIYVIVFICIMIFRAKVSLKKRAYIMVISSTVTYSIMFYFIYNNFSMSSSFFNEIIISYIPTSLIGGFLALYLANYIVTSNELYLELREQAHYDFLTGLKNTRQFHTTLESFFVKSTDSKGEFALLFIDIDFFKKINDTFGHLSGDKILQELGQLLIKSTQIDDEVYRYGGEEFAILIPHTNKENAIQIAERIRRKIKDHTFQLHGNITINITISVGVALSTNIKKPRMLIDLADSALYHAKNSGRNNVKFADKNE